jgi:hypothetical protein
MLIHKINIKLFLNSFLILLFIFMFSNCGIYKKVNTREVSTNADDRARKAISEGKGVNIRGIIGGGNKGFEFSSSNPLWRASLNAINFMPLANVDYAGGVIITDWYSAGDQSTEQVKIDIQFLSNEIRSDSIKISIFKKKCSNNLACNVYKDASSRIEAELKKTILSNAAILEKEDKVKK